ncbi:MAG: hypothetical protein ABIJ56_11040 [Pseudomonadota bacterium]
MSEARYALLPVLALLSVACYEGTGPATGGDAAADSVEPDARDGAEADDVTLDEKEDPAVDLQEETADIVEVEETPIDIEQEGEPLPCSDGEIRCDATGANVCRDGSWHGMGSCPLGCDEDVDKCYIPSNGMAGVIDRGTGDLDFSGTMADLYFNTDTGEIRNSEDETIREPYMGFDEDTEIYFIIAEQPDGAPSQGVFVMGELRLPAGITLFGEGANALALVATGDMIIGGIINVCASGQEPGCGGWRGGDGGEDGTGPCRGRKGEGTGETAHNCTSGGGGAGFGGPGGAGGEAAIECEYPGGEAGGLCGNQALTPLLGGSGGGGGGMAEGDESAMPGTGGGGGGAVQLVSATLIWFGPSSGIHAGGDGGGESNVAGGGGGGAGGAALIEAPDVDLARGAVFAANGGGGGAGDCT